MQIEREITNELGEEEITSETDITPDIDNYDGLDFENYDGEQPYEKHGELLKQLMDFSPYLRQKFEKWVNIVYDEKSGEYKDNKYGKQIMNNIGAHWAISFIDTYARNNNIITHISEQDYIWMKEDLIYTIWPNIYLRKEEFGITNLGDCHRVSIEIFHTALLVLMGSGDGKASKILTETTQRSEHLQYSPNNQMNGAQSMIMPPERKKNGVVDKLKRMLGG